MMSMSKSIPKLSTKYDYAFILHISFIKAINTPFFMMANALKERKCSFFDMKQTL